MGIEWNFRIFLMIVPGHRAQLLIIAVYSKILNISFVLIDIRKHILGGLYSGGGLYWEGSLC